jgi:hypothetical protein
MGRKDDGDGRGRFACSFGHQRIARDDDFGVRLRQFTRGFWQ